MPLNFSVQFSHSVVSDSLWPHGLQHTRLLYPSSTSGVYSNSCPTSWWCHPTSHPLSSPSPPAFYLSQHQGLFKWVSSSHQVAKLLEFQLQHQPIQWIFRTDFFWHWLVWSECSPRDFQESSLTPQFKSINSFFPSPSLLVCMGPLFWGGSLVDSIYRGLLFVSIQPVFVFWLKHSTHLHLR